MPPKPSYPLKESKILSKNLLTTYLNMSIEVYSKKIKQLSCLWCALKYKLLPRKYPLLISESSLNPELLWTPKMKDINPNPGYRINNGWIFWLFQDTHSDHRTSPLLYLENYLIQFRKTKVNGENGWTEMTLKITLSPISLKEFLRKKKSVLLSPWVWSEL